MVTINEFRKNQETRGKLFITYSKRFGIVLLLGIEYPSKHFEERNSFVNVLGSSVYHYSSVQSDEILHIWDGVRFMHSALEMLSKLKEDSNK